MVTSSFLIWIGLAGAATIVLTWIVYPLAIGLLSTFFPESESGQYPERDVSLILATREPEKAIRRRVRDLLRTQYPLDRLDLVVALDASAQQEVPDLSGLGAQTRLRVVRGRQPGGKAATLNSAVEHARGEIFVFADSGQRFAPDTIPNLTSAFLDQRVGAVSGNLILRRKRRKLSTLDLYWRMERWLRQREARIHSAVGVTGAVWALRASDWKDLPPGLILDDVHTPMRLAMEGKRVAYLDSARAYETRVPTPLQEHVRKTRTLTGVLQLCAWLPDVLIPWRNPLFLQFIFHKIFRLLTPYAAFAVLASGCWLLTTAEPGGARLGLGVLAGGMIWVLLGWPPPARWIRTVLWEIVLSQASVVRATLNGLRGRWDVWSPAANLPVPQIEMTGEEPGYSTDLLPGVARSEELGRTLVTGATGFTGLHLVRHLVAKGSEVVAFAGPSGNSAPLSSLGAEVRKVDLRRREEVLDAFEGFSTVYHVAAAFRTEHADRDEFRQVNVEGTRHLLEASTIHGVGRFLHCSTVGVQGDIEDPPAREDYRPKPGDHYQESKLEGELLALGYSPDSLPVTVVRPAGLYGPGDRRFLKLFRSLARGRFVMIGPGEAYYHLTYIDDFVKGMILAAENAEAVGEVFTIAGGRYTTLNELMEILAEVLNVRPPRFRIPFTPVFWASVLCERACRIVGANPPLFPRRMEFFSSNRAFDISKARERLDFHPEVSLREGLARTASWYRKEGLL